MFHKRICKRLKKTAFASVMATALTVTSVCTDGFGVAVHEMVKTEAATDDLFTIKDGVLTSYDHGKLGKDVVIPDGVTKIGESVFDNEYNIETVTIPDSVKEIGSQAFEQCKKLKTVKFGSGLESIDFRAFEGCTSLNNIQFPKGLTSIGMNAFLGCSALESIDFPTSVTSIEGNAFRDTPWLEAQIANSPDHLVRVNDILLDGT